jgi:hypothetical protein
VIPDGPAGRRRRLVVLLICGSRRSAARYTPYGRLALAYALLGAGQGLVNPPVTNAGVSGMPPEQAGVASAVISTTRQVGNVLGVAVMGAMLVASLRARLAAGTPRGQAFSEATHGPWALAVACGLLIAVVGLVATMARGRAVARVAAAEEG